jgi:hypothetical protein
VSAVHTQSHGYTTNFNEQTKGVEGAVVNAIIKPLVTKLMNKFDELIQPENTVRHLFLRIKEIYESKIRATHFPVQSIYYDVRSLLTFIQEHHGNPFRRVELSALLDAKPDLLQKVLTFISTNYCRLLEFQASAIQLNSFDGSATDALTPAQRRAHLKQQGRSDSSET